MFTFDLRTGHCISNRNNQTPPAAVYATRLVNGRVWLRRDPVAAAPPNEVSLDDGFRAQMALVQIGLDRKFGPADP